jgi:hypothetical protein
MLPAASGRGRLACASVLPAPLPLALLALTGEPAATEAVFGSPGVLPVGDAGATEDGAVRAPVTAAATRAVRLTTATRPRVGDGVAREDWAVGDGGARGGLGVRERGERLTSTIGSPAPRLARVPARRGLPPTSAASSSSSSSDPSLGRFSPPARRSMRARRGAARAVRGAARPAATPRRHFLTSPLPT